jgi:hypothetical protein
VRTRDTALSGQRTDELYEAVEPLLPTFRVVMAAVLRKVGMDPDKVVAELDSGEQIKALTLASGLKDPVSCRAVVGGRRELEGHGHSCVILYVLLTLFR